MGHITGGRRLRLPVAAVLTASLTAVLSGVAFASSAPQVSPSSTGTPPASTGSSPESNGPSAPNGTTRTDDSAPGATTPATLTITSISPTAGPASPLSVAFGLAATGGSAITDLAVRVGLAADPIDSRNSLDEIAVDATRTAADYPRTVVDQPLPAEAVLSGPNPVPFSVGPLDLSGLGLGSGLRVIPMRVGVSGVIDGTRQTVAFVHTFLVWTPASATPAAAVATTPVSVVVPLADRPHLRADGLLTDDELANQIVPGGRLYELLDAVPPPVGGTVANVALALDPVLLEALRTMATGPYRVATAAGPVEVPTKNSDAEVFLARLRAYASGGGTLIPLPYGDADVAALLTAGNRHTALAAVLYGRATVAAVLGADVPVDTTIAYLAGGVIDPGAGALLRDPKFGYTSLVLDDRLVPAQPELTYTPAAPLDVPTATGVMRVLAADHDLAAAVAFPTAAQPVALQTVLAELAVVTSERPAQSRPQLIALPHDWDPPTGWAQAVLRALSGPTPASTPAPLVTAPPDGLPGRAVVTSYPGWAAATQLPVSYVDGIDDIWAQADRLTTVRCGLEPATRPPATAAAGDQNPAPPDADATAASEAKRTWSACVDRAVDAYRRGLLRAASVFWRDDPGPGELIGQQVLSELNTFQNGIGVVASRIVTLTSNSGRVPVTVENNTAETVNVVLDLSSTDPARLRSASRVARTIPPFQKLQVEIEVAAQSAGTFPVDIRLLTPAGDPLSDRPALRILVKSSAYGVVAIAITVSAVAVLFLAVGVRTVRRLRRRNRPLATTDPATADPATADPATTDPEPPQSSPSPSWPTSGPVGGRFTEPRPGSPEPWSLR